MKARTLFLGLLTLLAVVVSTWSVLIRPDIPDSDVGLAVLMTVTPPMILLSVAEVLPPHLRARRVLVIAVAVPTIVITEVIVWQHMARFFTDLGAGLILAHVLAGLTAALYASPILLPARPGRTAEPTGGPSW